MRVMSKGTPHRAIRIPDEQWQALQAKAKEEGRDASTVIRELITKYLAER